MPDPGNSEKVAILIGDNTQGAPLYSYIGDENYFGDGSFLVRNGLAYGKLYVWVSNDGFASPQDWNGTGARTSGSFVEIEHYNPFEAGNAGYDELGFATQARQYELAFAGACAFSFSRQEDVATNPDRPNEVIMASTGRQELYPADSWGTLYKIVVNLSNLNNITANISVLYDGDDAGAGAFSHPDEGLRSPDNLDWADNGFIYVQEDRSITAFGSISGQEASIWEVNPYSGSMKRVSMVNRAAHLLEGQFDPNPSDIGNWETSGIIDVSGLVNGRNVLAINVQGHSINGGNIATEGLVEGGQILIMTGPNENAGNPSSASLLENGAASATDSQFFAYPNPVIDFMTLEYPRTAENTTAIIEVFDVQGKLIASEHATAKSTLQRIDLSTLTSGTYIVSLRIGDERYTTPFVKK